MNDFVVRTARPHELAAVAALRREWESEVHGAASVPLDDFVPSFTAWARENSATHRCVVALRDEVVVGMAWLALVRRVPHPRSLDRVSGDVQCVYVTPANRNLGAGGLLVEAVLRVARDLGVERVTVHSSTRAIPAYERAGFAVSPRLLQLHLTDFEAPPPGR